MAQKFIYSTLFFLAITTLFINCTKKGSDRIQEENTLLNKVIIIDGETCKDLPMQGIDSYTGKIRCGDHTFGYDYGWYGSKGPTSLVETFTPAFKAYHYSKFFMYLKMDEKAYKSLIKKTKVLNVVSKSEFKGELIYECEPCNAVAQIEFIGKVFNYPYTENKEILMKANAYHFGRLTESNVNYKWYNHKDSQEAGLYAYPLPDSQDAVKLSMNILSTNNKKEAYSILRKIRLAQTPKN